MATVRRSLLLRENWARHDVFETRMSVSSWRNYCQRKDVFGTVAKYCRMSGCLGFVVRRDEPFVVRWEWKGFR